MKFLVLLSALILVGVGCSRSSEQTAEPEGPAVVIVEESSFPAPVLEEPSIEGGTVTIPHEEIKVPEEPKEPPTKPVIKNDLHVGEGYSFTLPGAHTVNRTTSSEYISPQKAGAFPEILISWVAGKKDPTLEEILATERTHLFNLCVETRACGEIAESTSFKIAGRQAASYTVKTPGRAGDDPEGFVIRHHLVVPIIRMERDPRKPEDTKLYPFWYIANFVTSGTDLEKPEIKKKAFEAIMATLRLSKAQ